MQNSFNVFCFILNWAKQSDRGQPPEEINIMATRADLEGELFVFSYLKVLNLQVILRFEGKWLFFLSWQTIEQAWFDATLVEMNEGGIGAVRNRKKKKTRKTVEKYYPKPKNRKKSTNTENRMQNYQNRYIFTS